jgi:cytochrome c oxidase subunit 2
MKHKFQKAQRWIALGTGALLLALILPGTVLAAPPSPLTPGTGNAAAISDLFFLVLYIAIAVFVIVEGLLIFAIVRYRRRSDDEMPEQVHGNNALEITWTVIPSVIVIGLAALTFQTLKAERAVPADAMTVEVIGHQWYWEYHYPDSDVTVRDDFKVPTGQPVLLEVISADVQHSFWVPELGGKIDAIPGHVNTTWFQVDEPGTFVGQCAEYCGLEHYLMLTEVEAVSQAEFDAWIGAEIASAGEFQAIGTDLETPLPAGDAAAGETVYTELGCMACHSPNEGEVLVGPPLPGTGERAATRVADYTAEEYLRETILLPCDYLVDGFTCLMPQNFGDRLDAQGLSDLIAYLLEQ